MPDQTSNPEPPQTYRGQKANLKKMSVVNRRIASRLVRHGWTVTAPDGTVWEETGQPGDDSRYEWAKYK